MDSVSNHSHSYDFEVPSPGTNDTDLSVVWSRASDIFWSRDNCRGSVLMYLLDYGRRDFPFLKRRLKKLDRKLKRHQACGGLFARDQVERRRLGRIQALSTEIASHVHVATATFRKPGMRKFLAGGIGRNLCHLREKKHSCVIELPDGDAQSDDLGDASDFEAFLDELSRETEKYPSMINPNISSDVLARSLTRLNDQGANAGTLPETPVGELTKRAEIPNHVEDTSFSSTKRIRLKGTEVQVCVGDLTKETADAILVINQPNLNLREGGRLNQRIAQAGGPVLRMECDLNVIERGAQPSGSAVVTDAGALLCKHVVHAVCASCSRNVLNLQLAIKSGLQLADARGLRSIALPAIGTGGMGLDWKISAEILSRGILSFLEFAPTNLSLIKIVLFEHRMFAFFSEEVSNDFVPAVTLEEYSPLSIPSVGEKHTPDLHQSIGATNILNGGSAPRAPKSAAKFRIRVYGKDQKTILNVLTGLQRDFATYTSSQKVIHHLVPQLLQGTRSWNQLRDIAHWYEVTIQAESNANTITVFGNPDDVSLVVGRIWERINACAEENTEREKHRLLSKYVCWYFVLLDLPIRCCERVNGILEDAHDQRFNEVSFRASNKEFKADFGSMTILCSFSSSQPLPLVRKNLVETVQPPSSWVPHPCDNEGDECPVLLVPLDSSSCEYNHVAGMFYSTGGKGAMIKIERLQNPYLHKQYTTCKKDIERPNGRHSIYRLNELQLFHGTPEKNLKSINRQGFNRSFSGTRSGAMYGNGVYFAKNASYAMAYTSDRFGERHMYLARVVVGLFAKGRKGLRVPPLVDCRVPEVHYDSVVDNVDNPAVFVVFRDAQCYPEYLLTFKST